jgi:DNA-binding NarL/FixJ family response regulator
MKILLVDDHAVVRAGVRRLLEAEVGISILEAESSQDALEAWRSKRPDLIVLDLNLTGSSGLALLRRLVQLDKTVKILVLSMHSEPVYAARALQAGARGYVSKSAGAEEFVNAVRQVGHSGHYGLSRSARKKVRWTSSRLARLISCACLGRGGATPKLRRRSACPTRPLRIHPVSSSKSLQLKRLPISFDFRSRAGEGNSF